MQNLMMTEEVCKRNRPLSEALNCSACAVYVEFVEYGVCAEYAASEAGGTAYKNWSTGTAKVDKKNMGGAVRNCGLPNMVLTDG